jgi:hypothetical protein
MAVGDDFLPELFRGTEGLIYFCALRNSKSKLPPGEVAHIVTRDLDKIEGFRDKWDRPEHECGIYYHAATLKVGADRRIKTNCRQFSALFSDTDDANHELSRDMALALLEQAECPPTLIVDSGHGLQPYWLLVEPCGDAGRIERARKAIQSITASDNVADAARVMRLVGSHNCKRGNGEWLSVEIVSHNPEARYRLEDLEHWLERAPVIIPRKPEQKPEAKSKPKHDGGARHFYDDVPDLAIVRDALRFIPNDDREDWRNVGMALNDAFGDAGHKIWAEWSASSDKYDAADQEKNWRSFTPGGGITIGTLFHLAQEHGWQSNHRAGEPTAARGTDEPPHPGAESNERCQNGNLSYFGDLGEATPKPWSVKNVIARGECSSWFGPPGVGKSALLEDLHIHGAYSQQWRSYRIKENFASIYFALERADLVKRRMIAHRARDNLPVNLPIAIWSGVIDLMSRTCVDIILDTIKQAEDHFSREIGLATFDTYAKGIAAGGGDESQAKDQNIALANLRRVLERKNIHIATIGHTGKDESRGERGSNAKQADVDLEVQISGEGTIKSAAVTKANDQPLGPLTSFQLEPFDFGLDEDDDPFRTYIVAQQIISGVATKTRLSGKQQLGVDALAEATLKHGVELPASYRMPVGLKSVTADQWQAELYRLGALDRNAKNPTSRFSELRQALQVKRVIGVSDELVWLATK